MAAPALPLSEEDLHELYLWVDDIPLSKPKRNIARDFSDGVCVAEVVKHFFPKLVELHNYVGANSSGQKLANWNTLNARVFRKLHFEVPAEEIRDIIAAVPGSIERFLKALRTKISQIKSIQEQKRLIDENNYAHSPEFQAPFVTFGATAAPPQQPAPSVQKRPSSSSGQLGALTSATPSSAAATQKQLMDEKDRTILELRESVALLTDKVSRLEELVRVKDEKIHRYKQQLGK